MMSTTSISIRGINFPFSWIVCPRLALFFNWHKMQWLIILFVTHSKTFIICSNITSNHFIWAKQSISIYPSCNNKLLVFVWHIIYGIIFNCKLNHVVSSQMTDLLYLNASSRYCLQSSWHIVYCTIYLYVQCVCWYL